MSFLHKRVGRDDGLFGADLRDLRESRDIPLAQAAAETHLHDAMLQAFEEDRLDDLDDLTFAERHLVAYVRYLGGHEPYFTARYRQRVRALHAERKTSDLLPRMRNVRALDFFVGPQLLAIGGILLLASCFGGYVIWQASLVRTPPPLEVYVPQEGEVLQRPTVRVQGATMPEAYITVNGRTAAVDPQGHFSLLLDVRRGTTSITIVARRRRGSETRVERTVVYDEVLSDAFTLPVSSTSTTTPPAELQNNP